MNKYFIESQLNYCKKLWEKYIHEKDFLYENWEYNLLFHDSSTHDLYFIYNNNVFIPLVQEKISQKLTCFSSYRYQHIVIGDEEKIYEILNNIPFEIDLDDVYRKDGEIFKKNDDIFFLTLNLYSDWDDYIKKFKSEKKSKIRNQYRKTISQGFRVTEGSLSEIEKLFTLNIGNFGESSDFYNPFFKNSYKNLIREDEYSHYILTVKKEGRIYGVGYFLGYNDTLYYMNVGIDKEEKNLGKILFLDSINLAINKKYTYLNLGGGDCGWKEYWETEKIPTYKYIKNS